MDKETKPRYRIELLNWLELEEKFNSETDGFYWQKNDKSNRYMFITKI